MAEQEQGNIRQEFNLGRVGLNMDSSVNQVEKGKLTYALNAALENFDANTVSYQNEQGNELCLNFPEDFHLIGEHFIQEQNKHIFFLVNPDTGASQIGYMVNNDCVYHTYIQGACLNFNIDYPIHKAVHKITNCSTEIYWTDGLNPRRFLDLDNPPYTTTYVDGVICDPVTTDVIDCNKLKVQPNFNIPELNITEILTGGELTAGTYQFAIQYSNARGDGYTSYYSVTNPTPIANPQLTTTEFNYTVGKSIVISINNIDVTGYFQYYNLAAIKTVNGITSVELVGTYFISDNTNTITYTGQNQTAIRLTTAEIFEKYLYYEIAQDLTAVQDILVWDNLSSIDRVNYQAIASKINLQWETYQIPAGENYADALNATNLRGYLRDEVYAFEIVFLLDNGKQTDGFHIPGREANGGDLATVYKTGPNANADFIGNGNEAPYWKIYNTASVTGTTLGPTIGNATPYQYGEFAYWESDEEYPCNTLVYGDLAGKKIRHHKFPDVSVSPIFDSPAIPTINGEAAPIMEDRSVYPIGVKIDAIQVKQLIDTSALTQEEKDAIVGFKIVRGDRSTNKSIVAKGILRNVGKYTREGTDYYYPNYPYNDLNVDPFLLDKNNAYNSQCDSFIVNVSVAGSLQITDCFTGNVTAIEMPVGYNSNICSITVPQVLTGTATVTQVNGVGYILSAYSQPRFLQPDLNFTIFEYTSIVTGGTETKQVNVNSPVLINSVTVPVRVSGSDRFSVLEASQPTNPSCYPSDLDGFNTDASRFRQVFNSPETSFGQPTLGNILKLESAICGGGKAHFVEVKGHSLYKLISRQAQIDALTSSYNIANLTGSLDATAMFTAYQAYIQIYINGISRQNFAYSFNSIASYDYSVAIDNGTGMKQRELDICQYLIPGFQSAGETQGITINNFQRESSVYTKTKSTLSPLPYPNKTPNLVVGGSSIINDTSRFILSQTGSCATPEKLQDINVVSYYGSIKNISPNQWGQLYSYNTIDTGFQRIFNAITSDQPDVVFGGDTFISKFAFKTKLPFFIDNRVNAPDDSDIYYDELGNVAYPKFWYSARSILSDYLPPDGKPAIRNIISVKAHNFDCPNDPPALEATTTTTSTTTTSKTGSSVPSSITSSYSGKMYLFAYGIPYYYVESSINVDLRQATNNLEGDFYPHVGRGIPDNWLQETVVPILFDNTYTYNVTYSKQNKENFFSHLPIDWNNDQCYTNYPFRAIYSDPQQSYTDNKVNSWLTYSPLSYFDFPQNYGELVSLDGIQNKAILARFENKSLLYNSLLTVNTSNPQAAYLGNPSLFKGAPPVDFAETDLGYVGSQNKMLLKIPQGQVTIDAKRGQVFLVTGIGGQIMDLSAFGSGLNRFFTDHLAFEILRYYPDVNTDNHFNGCGLHGVYDSKFDRVIISKLDYIPQVNMIGVVKYDAALQQFYINKTVGVAPYQTIVREYVNLTDIKYFCNKSWTLSFNMNTKSWVSFHSYIPNFYIAENNFFYSGLNEGCDLEAIAVQELPNPTTTTTTTTLQYCNLAGTAVYVAPTTTTTTSTSTSTTTSTSTSTSTTTTTTTIPTGTLTLSYTTFTTSFTLQASPATPQSIVLESFVSVTGYPNNSCNPSSGVASAGLTGNTIQILAGGTVNSAQRTSTNGTWGMGTPYSFDQTLIGLNINGVSNSYSNGQTILIGGILYTFTKSTTCV